MKFPDFFHKTSPSSPKYHPITITDLQGYLRRKTALCCHGCEGADDSRTCDSRYREDDTHHKAVTLDNIAQCPTLHQQITANNIRISEDSKSPDNTHLFSIQVVLSQHRRYLKEQFEQNMLRK